jgi:hypothetical protein
MQSPRFLLQAAINPQYPKKSYRAFPTPPPLKISYDFFQKSRDLKTTKELLLVPY